MKKYLFILAAFAAVASSSCSKLNEGTLAAGEEISLNATIVPTKTVINSGWTVSWDTSDALTVFNAGTGETSYSPNCGFTLSDASTGKFVKSATETSKALISGKEAYDWYVCYPYMQYAGAPGTTKGYTIPAAYNQKGYGNLETVADWDICAGKALNVAEGTSPDLVLSHCCTILKFTVINNSGSATPITGLTLDATECGSYINGSFSMDWSGAKPVLDPTEMGSLKSYVSTVNVVVNKGTAEEPSWEKTDVTVASGASADIYVIAAPFSLASGSKVTLTIQGGNGDCTVTKTMTKNVTFAAGTYNTATVSYVDPVKVLFYDDASGNTVSSKTHLKVFGTNSDRDGVAVTLSNGSAYISGGTGVSGTSMAGGCWRLSTTKTTSNVKYTGVHVYDATKIRISFDAMKTCSGSVTLSLKYKDNGASAWIAKDASATVMNVSPVQNAATHVSYDLALSSGTETIQFYIGANPTGDAVYFDNVKIIDISE